MLLCMSLFQGWAERERHCSTTSRHYHNTGDAISTLFSVITAFHAWWALKSLPHELFFFFYISIWGEYDSPPCMNTHTFTHLNYTCVHVCMYIYVCVYIYSWSIINRCRYLIFLFFSYNRISVQQASGNKKSGLPKYKCKKKKLERAWQGPSVNYNYKVLPNIQREYLGTYSFLVGVL